MAVDDLPCQLSPRDSRSTGPQTGASGAGAGWTGPGTGPAGQNRVADRTETGASKCRAVLPPVGISAELGRRRGARSCIRSDRSSDRTRRSKPGGRPDRDRGPEVSCSKPPGWHERRGRLAPGRPAVRPVNWAADRNRPAHRPVQPGH